MDTLKRPKQKAPARKDSRRKGNRLRALRAAVTLVLLLALLVGCTPSLPGAELQPETVVPPISDVQMEEPSDAAPVQPEAPAAPQPVVLQKRQQLLRLLSAGGSETTPSVTPYTAGAGLCNVVNLDQFYLTEEQAQLLEQNLFVVSPSYSYEFFQKYESNRYNLIPNFVTVDSLMHTYHLYFSLLLSRTEKNYLAESLLALSQQMLQASLAQYDVLADTDWAEAAERNVAFFAVAVALQDAAFEIPVVGSALAEAELTAIYAADSIDQSAVGMDYVDYSQFQPRGYYAGDAVLEAYFRAMMWYGQINFAQQKQSLSQSALLMTLAMQESGLELWQTIYTVTACFAGVSDDLGYYEYAPLILEAYGAWPQASALADDKEAFACFASLAEKLSPPAINSVPVWQFEEGDVAQMKKGFRFMGQRFSIDAAVMQQLVYRKVEENGNNDQRLLPDVLDLPAALGSQMALELLTQQGAMEYKNYPENMQALRTAIQAAPEELWSSSLSSSWLYTLSPLLTVKGEGYPSFMTGSEWQKKNLETYAGSYTELKHDTVLYAKQVMAEMGGGPLEPIDDRGYVEPEVEVYHRFQMLAQQTAEGLQRLGLLSAEDLENLSRLEELAGRLLTISEKELQEQTLTDEEYELIRAYGGTLEHFWTEAAKEMTQTDWLATKEMPAPVVTDIATDPNGTVLQIATGRPANIYVIVPVDGTLRIASGVAYDFYQFEQPMSNRLTDSEWRQMIGVWQNEDGTHTSGNRMEKPWWTQSYWSEQ